MTEERINAILKNPSLTIRRLGVLNYLRKRKGCSLRQIESDMNLKIYGWFGPTTIYEVVMWLKKYNLITRDTSYPANWRITSDGLAILNASVDLII